MDTTANLIRPITIKDLDVLYDIALESGPGFTSLPANRDLLAERIRHSCSAMERSVSSPKAKLICSSWKMLNQVMWLAFAE